MNSDDEILMNRAIEQAEQCRPIADRIPKVGAVIAVGGTVIGMGHRGTGQTSDDDHAEMVALRGVADRGELAKATVYTTLEPCTPEVRSDPLTCCTELIRQAEVKRVFIGILDPNQGVRGKGLWELQERGIALSTTLGKTDPGSERQVYKGTKKTGTSHNEPELRAND